MSNELHEWIAVVEGVLDVIDPHETIITGGKRRRIFLQLSSGYMTHTKPPLNVQKRLRLSVMRRALSLQS